MRKINLGIIETRVENIKKRFTYKRTILDYNAGSQAYISTYLEEISKELGIFDEQAKYERDNIDLDLTIVDTKTGEKISLVDIDSLDKRISDVLKENNQYTCLKTLALCNKCAHSSCFDIYKSRLTHYYDLLYGIKVDPKSIDFSKSPGNALPLLYSVPYYDTSNISEYEIDQLYKLLYDEPKPKKGAKISALNKLGIQFNKLDDEDIDAKFKEIVLDRDAIINNYMWALYKDCAVLSKTQQELYAIKDFLISMIGQLLVKGELGKVYYELVKTSSGTGFDNMLVINDLDLAYYIEVHMPNFIANSFVTDYGMKLRTSRKTSSLYDYMKNEHNRVHGISSVYRRKKREVIDIKESINDGLLASANIRARIFSRGWPSNSQKALVDPTILSSPFYSGETSDYRFITHKISDNPSLLEKFCKKHKKFSSALDRMALIRHNENYNREEIHGIISFMQKNIINSMDNSLLNDFLINSLTTLSKGDSFDKKLYLSLINNEELLNNKEKIIDILIDRDFYKEIYTDKVIEYTSSMNNSLDFNNKQLDYNDFNKDEYINKVADYVVDTLVNGKGETHNGKERRR